MIPICKVKNMKLEGREFWKSWRLGTGTESKRAPRTQGNFKKQEDIHIYQLESKSLQRSSQQTSGRAEEVVASRSKTGFSPTPLPQSVFVTTLCSFLAIYRTKKENRFCVLGEGSHFSVYLLIQETSMPSAGVVARPRPNFSRR